MNTTRKGDVLVVDDEPVVREFLARVLTEEGYRVTLAKNGVEGLAAARAQPMNLIIVDLNMPGMDGVEFTRQARTLSVPILVFSGAGTREKLEASLRAGVKDFLVKGSFKLEAFLSRVKKHLSEKKPSPP